MAKPIKDIHQFIQGLTSGQRRFFAAREDARQNKLQECMTALGHGLTVVSELNGNSLAIVLAGVSGKKPIANKRPANHRANRSSKKQRDMPQVLICPR